MVSTIQFDVFRWLSIDELFLEAVEAIRRTENFSNADFARLFKFKSRAHLRLVIQGKRGITETMVATLIKKFHWNKMESRYVMSLWKLSQNPTDDEKIILMRSLRAAAQYRSTTIMDLHAMAYLSQWWIVAFREALFLSWFQKLSDSKMAKSLGIELSQLKEAQKCCAELGLITCIDNQWVPADVPLKASKNLLKKSAQEFHRMMARKGLEALNPLDKDTQEFQSLTLPVSKEKMEEIRAIILECANEIRSTASATDGELVYQLNIQFFPLVRFSH